MTMLYVICTNAVIKWEVYSAMLRGVLIMRYNFFKTPFHNVNVIVHSPLIYVQIFLRKILEEILNYMQILNCVWFVFVCRGKSWSSSADGLGPDKHAKDVESLDKYAMERWEVSYAIVDVLYSMTSMQKIKYSLYL